MRPKYATCISLSNCEVLRFGSAVNRMITFYIALYFFYIND